MMDGFRRSVGAVLMLEASNKTLPYPTLPYPTHFPKGFKMFYLRSEAETFVSGCGSRIQDLGLTGVPHLQENAPP